MFVPGLRFQSKIQTLTFEISNAAALLSWAFLVCARVSSAGSGSVAFETTSAYHHIRVIDHSGMRTLCFDDAWESQIAINDPLKGHFEYTEYFHMPWLWNTQIVNVLMIGLGGGTTQRSFEHYYPDVNVQSVEIDPMVARVAR